MVGSRTALTLAYAYTVARIYWGGRSDREAMGKYFGSIVTNVVVIYFLPADLEKFPNPE